MSKFKENLIINKILPNYRENYMIPLQKVGDMKISVSVSNFEIIEKVNGGNSLLLNVL